MDRSRLRQYTHCTHCTHSLLYTILFSSYPLTIGGRGYYHRQWYFDILSSGKIQTFNTSIYWSIGKKKCFKPNITFWKINSLARKLFNFNFRLIELISKSWRSYVPACYNFYKNQDFTKLLPLIMLFWQSLAATFLT